ncbi:MAG: Response regulator rcp1 [Planctomycetes bacterium ADurb.Bin401]|nr:MAG: Response regulator rcp1 [Planctomycetes bacterium ADurb.Bin401]
MIRQPGTEFHSKDMLIVKGIDMEYQGKMVNVLMVENDPGDQKLIKSGIANTEYNVNLHVVSSAEQGLEFLHKSLSDPHNYPRPGLVLLDLNMPGMGGKGFLKEVKADENFCSIPVVVVTSSDLQSDVDECYQMHAAGYIQKNASASEFAQILHKIARYWFPVSAVLNN